MIDFRSDTVTRPSPDMKRAMMDAPLGDDVFGDDPSVNLLQEMAADMLGFEAALLLPSGTQANLVALMTHCRRGDEAIVGQQWHTYRWEAGGMAVIGSIQPQPLENQADGTIALADIENAIKPDDPHFAPTRLITLENTTGGKVLPMNYLREVRELARRHDLRTHIDGARLFNAAVAVAQASGAEPLQAARDICDGYDSVSVCLSKGLGAPVGSLLFGDRPFIAQARRHRKMLGGGMRQAGLLAAAGIYALRHNIERLADDHLHTGLLAEGLARIIAAHPKLAGKAVVHGAQTNMVFMDVDGSVACGFMQYLADKEIRVTGGDSPFDGRPGKRLRWVTHLDVSRTDIEQALTLAADF